MIQHAPFKYAWRLPPYDNRVFESLIKQFSQHPDVCDEVWLFMSEPTSYGYHPLEQVEELCQVIQKQMDAFRALGIRAGINLWPTFGAQDSGCDANLRPPMPFPIWWAMTVLPLQPLPAPLLRNFYPISGKNSTSWQKHIQISFGWTMTAASPIWVPPIPAFARVA